MINDHELIREIGPEQALTVVYAPSSQRDPVIALWQLDVRLRAIALTAREPMLARIKLQWWADRLVELETATAPNEPLLQVLKADWGVEAPGQGAQLAMLASGWQHLVADDMPTLDDVMAYAAARGTAMFALLASHDPAGASDALLGHGTLWALADFGRLLPEGPLRAAVNEAGRDLLHRLAMPTVPRSQRMTGALALLARRDIANNWSEHRPSPRRMARLVWHRWTGR